jgi:hypothetical protein
MQAKREDDTFITWLHSAKFTDLGRRYREGPISTSLRDAIEGEYIRRGVKPPKRPRFGAPKARTEEPSPTDTFGAWLSTATDEQLNKQLEIFVKEHSNPAERERIREELNSRAADNAPSKERSVEEIMDDLAAKGTEREINEILDEGN